MKLLRNGMLLRDEMQPFLFFFSRARELQLITRNDERK